MHMRDTTARFGTAAVIVGMAVLLTSGCSGATTSGDGPAETSMPAGSSETAESNSDGEGAADEGAADEGTAGAVAACEAVTTGGYGMHSDPAMTVVPEPGQVFGDGTPIAFQYSVDGLDPYATFGYDLAYIQDNGGAIAMGGAFFDADTATGAFGTSNAVFESNADGRPGIMTVTVTSDSALSDDNEITATTTELGQYCVTFEVE